LKIREKRNKRKKIILHPQARTNQILHHQIINARKKQRMMIEKIKKRGSKKRRMMQNPPIQADPMIRKALKSKKGNKEKLIMM
jgi:vacuolar-type H+-ATPase subunit H